MTSSTDPAWAARIALLGALCVAFGGCSGCAIPCTGDASCPAQLPVCARIVDGTGTCSAVGGEGEGEGGEGEGGEGEGAGGEGEGEGAPFVELPNLPPAVFDAAFALDGLDVVGIASAPPIGYTGVEPPDLFDCREGAAPRKLPGALIGTEVSVDVDPTVGVRGFGLGFNTTDGTLFEDFLLDGGDAVETIDTDTSSTGATPTLASATTSDTTAAAWGIGFVALLYVKGPAWSAAQQVSTIDGAVSLSSSSLATVACVAPGHPQLLRFTGSPPWSDPVDVDSAAVADGIVRCAVDEDGTAAVVYRTSSELVLATLDPSDAVTLTTLHTHAFDENSGPRTAAVALFQGQAYVVFVNAFSASDAAVVFRAPDGTEENVARGSIAHTPAIAVDASGRVVISFIAQGVWHILRRE